MICLPTQLFNEYQTMSSLKLHIHTFPVPTPIPIVFPDTAEHNGRYSEGSHTQFSELYVIHSPSELKAQP